MGIDEKGPKYLLMFHLGPVQPFIAQARKTSDLWMGSYLLSWLMRTSLEAVYRDNSTGLIFPHLRSDKPAKDSSPPADTPNKFVAWHNTTEEAEKAAKAVEAKIREQWQLVVDKAKEQTRLSDAELGDAWVRQINPDNLFEIAWVVVPYEQDQYGKAYEDALSALDGRKLLHAFNPQDERGEKSTISGERQALPCTIPVRDQPDKPKLLPERVSGPLRMSENERLDAIDVVRRRAPYIPELIKQEGATREDLEPPFPSADTVAAEPFLLNLKTLLESENAPTKLVTAVQEWLLSAQAVFPAHPFAHPGMRKSTEEKLQRWETIYGCDGEALFLQSYSQKRLSERPRARRHPLEAASGLARTRMLRSEARAAKLQLPSPYYTVIKLDGDRMGEIVGSIQNPKAHTAFSQALSTFAHGLQTWVGGDDYLGRVVYAGGDDALILAPADRALALAQKLQTGYVAAATQALEGFAQEKKSEPPTASVGIAIAHRLMPLRIVIEEARRAEEAAKHRYGRNALAVTVLWRGGRSVSVGAQWEKQDASQQPKASGETGKQVAPLTGMVALVALFQTLFQQDILSDKFAYSLEEEAPALVGLLTGATGTANIERAEQGMISEIKRLLKRQRKEGKKAELPDEPSKDPKDPKDPLAIGQIAAEIVRLAQAIEKAYSGKALSLAERGPRRGLVEVCGWLRLASFLARGRDAGEDE